MKNFIVQLTHLDEFDFELGDHGDILGSFTTREAAQEAIDKSGLNEEGPEKDLVHLDIVEVEMDRPITHQVKRYH